VFLERNPYFNGKISVIGHSLGTLILFDILTHQTPDFDHLKSTNPTSVKSSYIDNLDELLSRLNMIEYKNLFEREKITMESLLLMNESDLVQIGLPLGPRKTLVNEIKNNLFRKEREEVEKKILADLEASSRRGEKSNPGSIEYFNYGLAGTGQPLIKYPKLNFQPANFFALGSPIPMFLTVRGIEHLGTEFKLPTCDSFFNIFHPVSLFFCLIFEVYLKTSFSCRKTYTSILTHKNLIFQIKN
jgi:hypothetical protein